MSAGKRFMKNTTDEPGSDINLFLDSNVILSGLLSSPRGAGAPRILLDLLGLKVPLLKGMTGQYNLEEIERDLKRRFPQLWPVYHEYLPKMNLQIIEVPPYEEVVPFLNLMSPKDAPVLASARMGGAHYLVTGDKKGFPRDVVSPILLATPSQFLEKILPDLISR